MTLVRTRPFVAALVTVAALAAIAVGLAASTFDGSPPSPLPLAGAPGPAGSVLAEWDVQVHSRDTNTWYQLEAMYAGHGPECAGPPASHVNNSYEGAVYQCRDHVMTAINASGYGVIYLTPPQLVDFSAGPAVIQWEMSTEALSKRDWWDVWVTPYADNLALPFDTGDVDLQGIPRRGFHLNSEGGNAPKLSLIREYTAAPGAPGPPISDGIAAGTNQAATRQTFRLTLSATGARFERVESATATAVLYWDYTFEAVDWRQGVVQFGHHSYTPTKDGSGVPGTWHWDNISVNPAQPFTVIKADRRYVDAAAQTVTFARPAPANSHLRFSGIGAIEVSVDGGPFVAATRQVGSAQNTGHVEHMSSYWHPLPEGAQTVRLRFGPDAWYGGPFIATDFAIWSTSTPTGGEPTSTATAEPSSTPPAPTQTATLPPSATATATATPIPATSTPTPATYRCQRRVGSNWITVWQRTGGGTCP
jgi:hypothetical protein